MLKSEHFKNTKHISLKNLGAATPRFLIMLVSLVVTIQPFANVVTDYICYDGIEHF